MVYGAAGQTGRRPSAHCYVGRKLTALARLISGATATSWRKQIKALAVKYAPQYAFGVMWWSPEPMAGGYFISFYQPSYIDAARIAHEAAVLTAKPLRQFKYLADPDKKGDTAGYAKPDFNDKDWKTTDVAVET